MCLTVLVGLIHVLVFNVTGQHSDWDGAPAIWVVYGVMAMHASQVHAYILGQRSPRSTLYRNEFRTN